MLFYPTKWVLPLILLIRRLIGVLDSQTDMDVAAHAILEMK